MSCITFLLALFVALGASRSMVFNPPAPYSGDPSFDTQANWNLPLPLTAADVVTIQITSCSTTGAPPYAAINTAVSIKSLTVDSQVSQTEVGNPTSCPSTVIISASVTVAGPVTVLSQSKMALANGGSLSCDTLQVQGFGVIGGSGVITASTRVNLWTSSYIIPGVYYDASCNNCWPQWGNTPSGYGDLKFATPTTNAEENSQFYFKDLSSFAEQTGRLNPGTPYDTVTFTGTLNANGTDIGVVHSNNTGFADGPVVFGTVVPMLWGSDALIMQWGWINLIQPFSFSTIPSGAPVLRCVKGFSETFPGFQILNWVCPHGNPFDCVGSDNCQVALPCVQPAASALSLVAVGSTGQCAAQAQPSSVIEAPTTSTTGSAIGAGGLAPGVLVAIIVVPILVVGGIAGIIIYVLHRRSVISNTKLLSDMAKAESLNDLKQVSNDAKVSQTAD